MRKNIRQKRKRGFTLIELLVTISITALLAAYMVLYGSQSRQQVALSVEVAKLAQIVSRAKSLSISTFNNPNTPCGYGVEVDYSGQKYSLMSYQISPSCRAVYSGGLLQISSTSVVSTYSLAPEVRLTNASSDAMTDVIFVPPDPKTITNLSGNLSTQNPGSFYLRTADGVITKRISVNTAGQISF